MTAVVRLPVLHTCILTINAVAWRICHNWCSQLAHLTASFYPPTSMVWARRFIKPNIDMLRWSFCHCPVRYQALKGLCWRPAWSAPPQADSDSPAVQLDTVCPLAVIWSCLLSCNLGMPPLMNTIQKTGESDHYSSKSWPADCHT